MKLKEAKEIAKDAEIYLKGREEDIRGTGYYTVKTIDLNEDTTINVCINIRKYKDINDAHFYYGVTSLAEIDGGDNICDYDEDFTSKCNQDELAKLILNIVNNGFPDEELLEMYRKNVGEIPSVDNDEKTPSFYTEIVNAPNRGQFEVVLNRDETYPGVDVEFIPKNTLDPRGTMPRIVFEYPEDGKLSLKIWGDPNKEDPNQEITFDVIQFITKQKDNRLDNVVFDERYDNDDNGTTTLYFTAPKELLSQYVNAQYDEAIGMEISLEGATEDVEHRHVRNIGISVSPVEGDEDNTSAYDWTDIDMPYEEILKLYEIAGIKEAA